MIRQRKSIFQDVDWIMLLLYLVMVVLGWLNIYAAVYNEEHKSILDTTQRYGHQMLFIGGAFVIAFIILFIDGNLFATFAYPLYGVVMFACVAVIFLSHDISGSRSWFSFGSFGLQPAEFGKFATAMVLAKYLSSMNIRMQDLSTKLVSAAIIVLPMLIIIAERETGSAIVYAAFVFVLYREGLSGNFLLLGFFATVLLVLALIFDKIILVSILGGVAALFLLLIRRTRKNVMIITLAFLISSALVFGANFAFNHLAKHQQVRIKVLLGMEDNPESKKKEGYNVYQSQVAIGSGGFAGKGFLQGTQTKYDYVPEQSTDFIFCTVGEEWGFLGSTFVLLLFLALIWRIIFVAERQRSTFSRIYGYGVASILFFHLTVNVGMTIGLAPVIGIPLPFFSYGGSSLWSFTILLFIFIRLDSDRLQVLR
ncbi:MAG TPA: rod shape-determining protein RodA [Bacteroidia bacterium]|jgi:rod shape determining protein RodA